jgi:hypothetical protein
LQRAQRRGNFEQLQDDRLIRAKHVSGCNSEAKLIAYLASGTGNGNSDGTVHCGLLD